MDICACLKQQILFFLLCGNICTALIFSVLSDCSLNEDNYSLRCPKHKVKKERLVYIQFLGKFHFVWFSENPLSFSFGTLVPHTPITDCAVTLHFLQSLPLTSNFLSFFPSLSHLSSFSFFTQFTQSIRPTKSVYLEQSERGWAKRRRDAGVWEL